MCLIRNGKAALLASLALLATAPALAADPLPIPGFGKLVPTGEVANGPDPSLRYRVAFEVTRTPSDPAQINPALDRVARFVNLLGEGGVRPAAGDIVVVMHGPASASIMTDKAYQAKFGRLNPNTALIAALRRAGVSVHICSYALANQKIARADVQDGVVIDLAAMVTLANLQLAGWAIIAG
jgi:intracellular sulfur oxidation DsrE/DsrF family protein